MQSLTFQLFLYRRMDLKLIQITCDQLPFIQLSPMFLPAVVSETEKQIFTGWLACFETLSTFMQYIVLREITCTFTGTKITLQLL